MSKTLYLDCFSGASGDMLLGALLDLGVKLSALEWELGKLELPEHFHLHADKEMRQHMSGIKFTVHGGKVHQEKPAKDAHAHDCGCGHDHGHEHHDHQHGHEEHSHEHHHHEEEQGHHHAHGEEHHHHDHDEHSRSYADIKQMISTSDLSDFVKERSISVFRRLAQAEGKIHNLPEEKVTFHEVGAIDSIIDILGFCIALEKLGKPRVIASALVEGTGFIECAHGQYPIPAPATLEVLQGIPLSQTNEENEMITPTGAALLAEFAESFGPVQNLSIEKIGYGLGTKHFKRRPNVLRAVLGEQAAGSSSELDFITVLETNLDDVTGEILGDVQEKLFQAGALDVYLQPIQMKKSRPGVILCVLTEEEKAPALTEIILSQTTAFGVRQTQAKRWKLERKMEKVETSFGPIAVKLGYFQGGLRQISPEFEDCRKISEKKGVPVQTVFNEAKTAGEKLFRKKA